MKKDLIIEKREELIRHYRAFAKWVNKYTKDIIESQRGRNYLTEIAKIESELAELNQDNSDVETELFEKVYIKSGDDLPEVKGEYYAHSKSKKLGIWGYGCSKSDEITWMAYIDWYLRPIKQDKPGKAVNFITQRELTDEEWLKLPKEEILHLYKNCYTMLQNYIGLSGEKVEDIPTITTTFEPIQLGESSVVNEVMEHAIKKAGKRKTEPIKSAEEILKNHFNPKHVIWAAGTTSQTIIMIMLEYAGQFRQKEVPLTAEEISLKDKILEEAKNGNIVVSTFEGLMAYSLKEVVEQPISGLLYDLNRDQATILTFINDPKWVNDYACYQVICELKSRLEASQFQPKEIVLPIDIEIVKWANSLEKIEDVMPGTLKLHIQKKIECRIEGAKWLRNLIEKQK